MKKKICALLSVLLSLNLCSCKNDTGNDANSSDLLQNGIAETGMNEGKLSGNVLVPGTGIYLSKEYTLPEDVEILYGASAVNDKIIITGNAGSNPSYCVYLYDTESGKTVKHDLNPYGIQNINKGIVTDSSAYLCVQKEDMGLYLALCDFKKDAGTVSDSKVEINDDSVVVYLMEQDDSGDISLICSGVSRNNSSLFRNTYDRITLELKKSEPVCSDLFDDKETSILSVVNDNNNGFFVLLEKDRGDYSLYHISETGETVFSENDGPDDIGGIFAAMYLTEDKNPVIIAWDEENEGLYHADVFDKDTGMTVDRYDFSIQGEEIELFNKAKNNGDSFNFTQLGKTFTFDPDNQTFVQHEVLSDLAGLDNSFCNALDQSENSLLFYSALDSKFTGSDNSCIWITDTAGNVLSKIKNSNAHSYDYAVSGNSIYLAEKSSNNLIITEVNTDDFSVSEIKADVSEYPDFSPGKIDISTDGTIILSSGTELLLIDNDGNIINHFAFNNYEEHIYDITAAGSGYALLKRTPEDTKLYYAENISSEPEMLELEIKNISGFANTFDKMNLYMVTSEGVLKYSLADKTSSFIMKWADSEISASPSDDSLYITSSGNLVWSAFEGNKYKVFLYSEADEETADRVKSKEILTVACDGQKDFIKRAVAEFNRTNSDFRIEINDYEKYSQSYKDNTVYDKMNLDIVSGNLPDIVIGGNNIDISHFSRMGMFADLNRFFEDDSEFDRSDFFGNILESYSSDGKQYCIPLNTFINAVLCRENVPGKENSWTFDEFFSADSLFYETSREDMVKYLITENLDEYVDFSEMKCSFDDIYFSKLLTYIKENAESEEEIMKILTTENGYSEYRDRFINNTCNAELLNLQYADKLSEYSELSSFNLRGMPSESENVYPSVSSDSLICISEKSGHKDEAWKFIKLLMSEKYQDTIGENSKHTLQLSIRKDSFEKMMADFASEAGADTAEKLRKAVEYSNKAVLSDSRITGIINEQCALFFTDSQTIYETVNNIQNQVRTYLMEIK